MAGVLVVACMRPMSGVRVRGPRSRVRGSVMFNGLPSCAGRVSMLGVMRMLTVRTTCRGRGSFLQFGGPVGLGTFELRMLGISELRGLFSRGRVFVMMAVPVLAVPVLAVPVCVLPVVSSNSIRRLTRSVSASFVVRSHRWFRIGC